MFAFLSSQFSGLAPGRRRCSLPQIQSPDFRNGTREDFGRLLFALIVVVFAFFAVFYLGQQRRQSDAGQPAQVHPSLRRTEIAQSRPAATVGNFITTRTGFGWLTFIAKPLYLALRFLHDHGVGNWGWSIILLTALFNLFIIWPRVISVKSSLKMMRLQPEVEALKKSYAHLKISDPKRAEMNTEMMALYDAEGVKPLGGCVPLLLQMPLLFAFMNVLRNAAELHHASWLWLADLSLPDPLHILPVLIIGSMALTQFITPSPNISLSQRRILAILMPVVTGFSLWHYASGLSLYWLTGSIISLLVQIAINHSRIGREMLALGKEEKQG